MKIRQKLRDSEGKSKEKPASRRFFTEDLSPRWPWGVFARSWRTRWIRAEPEEVILYRAGTYTASRAFSLTLSCSLGLGFGGFPRRVWSGECSAVGDRIPVKRRPVREVLAVLTGDKLLFREDAMIQIDGAKGEGGGQILRSALALSVLTGIPFEIINIRAKRANPGLQAQHLQAVRAAGRISHAEVQGADLRSKRLVFKPRGKEAGSYAFDIGTAGSALLVVQTLYLPLAAVRGRSVVTVVGGTHVPWSPCFHYLKWIWCRFLESSGFRCDLRLEKAGFYPKGGGRIVFEEEGIEKVKPLELHQRGELVKIWGYSAVARLPLSIAERQRNQALRRLETEGYHAKIELDELRALSPGTVIVLVAEFENTRVGYVGLGEKGKPAEYVANEAANGLLNFLAGNATVDEYQADQLLLPLSVSEGPSFYRTPRVTNHLLTNAEVVRRFLPAEIQIQGNIGSEGEVTIRPGSSLRDYL